MRARKRRRYLRKLASIIRTRALAVYLSKHPGTKLDQRLGLKAVIEYFNQHMDELVVVEEDMMDKEEVMIGEELSDDEREVHEGEKETISDIQDALFHYKELLQDFRIVQDHLVGFNNHFKN